MKARALNRRKLKEEHKICLENILKEQRYNAWTINKIKMKLIIEFPHLHPIFNSTISRCLNKELGYTFGKLEKKAKPSLTETSIRRVLEGAYVQKCMAKQDIEWVLFEEFSVNTRHHRYRGWRMRGHKGYIKVDTNEFSMSFIVGVSARKVYGIVGSLSSITSSEVKTYIKQLVETRNQEKDNANDDFVLIYDNAKVHVSKVMKDFVKKTKIRALSIPPYSPFLNATEKLINCIKMKLLKMSSDGRQVIKFLIIFNLELLDCNLLKALMMKLTRLEVQNS